MSWHQYRIISFLKIHTLKNTFCSSVDHVVSKKLYGINTYDFYGNYKNVILK